jgi:DNA invertase Pin-like site-specific DNA recombinase
MRFAILARRSMDKENFKNQIEAVEKWICDNGHELYCIYQEDEHGDTKQVFREVLQQILSDATKKEFDGLAVWHSDRLTREGGYGLIDLVNKFTTLSILLFSYREGWLKNENAEDELVLAAKGYGGRKELENIRARTKNALATIQKEIGDKGFHIAKFTGKRITALGRPRGRIGKVGEAGHIFTEREVLDIQEAHRNGSSLRELAREYNCSTTPILRIINEKEDEAFNPPLFVPSMPDDP